MSGFEQVSGEAVAETVAVHFLFDPGVAGGGFDGFLDGRFVHVVASRLGGSWGAFLEMAMRSRIIGQSSCREEVLPRELFFSAPVFLVERVGEPDPAGPSFEISLMLSSDEQFLQAECVE